MTLRAAAATQRPPGDAAIRRRLLEDFDTTFVVEAAAGTGKTTVLVGRIVKVVRSGRARLSQIIAVTFTERAAGEMKLRLRVALEQERCLCRDDDAERARLTFALEELEIARIGTIHGLCADLLREYPVEARVDPNFEVISQGDARSLLHAAFAREFQALVSRPPEGVRRILRRRPKGRDDEPPRKLLFGAVEQLVEHRDFAAPWSRNPFERDRAIDALIPAFDALADIARRISWKAADSAFCECLSVVVRFSEDLAHRESVAARDYDGLEAQLRDVFHMRKWLWTSKPSGVRFEGVTVEAAGAARAALYEALGEFVRRSEVDIAGCLHAELLPVVAAYEREKANVGGLDFVDLLLKARDLVRDNRAVREKLQRRFTHLFVDEFQDTDPLQSELVLLLASDEASVERPFDVCPVPGKLFVVGDPKQSIYRFRRADVVLYEKVKRHLMSHGGALVQLSTSFRSTPGIQAAINGAFEQVMHAGAGHQAEYVPLGPWREAFEGQPSVIALPPAHVFSPKGWPTKEAVEASVPDTVGAFVEWLVRRSGWTVEEGGQRVPVQPRHVCILFKRLRKGTVDVPRPYAQAMEARNVPHVLVGGRSFHEREEVMAVRAALLAIERPSDELSVYATLKGPFFALGDDQLLVFRSEVGRLHPLRPFGVPGALELEELSQDCLPVAQALGVLRELHLVRNRQSVASTIHALLESTRAQAGLAFWAAGAQALANVLHLAAAAARMERRAISFREVVETLEEEASEGEAPEAPLVEEGTEGVRMMTVHAAKGLEFPVVILAEPTANAARATPSHWVDPDAGLWVHALAGCQPAELLAHEKEVLELDSEESIRVAYVAATRARDVLVIPAVGDKRWESTWTQVLYPAIYPVAGTEHAPKSAPGCPDLGRDVVQGREGPVPGHVPLPGRHLAQTRKNGVVWWGPAALEIDKEARSGLQAAEALELEPSANHVAQQEATRWSEGRERALEAGLKPSERVQVARELKCAAEGVRVEHDDTGVARVRRPRGARFGELVHAVLATIPLDASRQVVERACESHARALSASGAEQRACAEAVEAALRHSLLLAARGARKLRRESAIVDVLADGSFVEGNVDLAFLDASGWTIVEFKTDEDVAAHREAYEAQVAAYVSAVKAATGLEVRGVLLRV